MHSVDLEGNRNLIDAAKPAGVKQFVFISILGADLDSAMPLFQAKARTEEYLRSSGISYTILAPDTFMESWVAFVVGRPLKAGQLVIHVREGRRKHAFVSAADVAAFATAVVNHPAAVNQYIAICGIEALSWRDVVDAFECVLVRGIPVRHVSSGDSVPGWTQALALALARVETFDSTIDMTESARTFGVTMTPLEEFVRSRFASNFQTGERENSD